MTRLGEYQPIYDEFGSIFLLILCFVHRYGLCDVDMGIQKGSFVSDFLQRGYASKRIEDLTEDDNLHVEGWLRGLLDPNGFSDELMSACKPQQFYLLLPTLFHQMLGACVANQLELDVLMCGLECML